MSRSANAIADRDARHSLRMTFLVALLVGGNGLAIPSGAAQQTPVEVASLAATPSIEIAGIREIELEFEPIAFSPDGSWIAGVRNRSSICLFSLVKEDSRCQDIPLDGSILPESISWAPDSSAIVFSLDAVATLRNSDIFVLDAEDGDLVDLTPDPAPSRTPEVTPTPGIGGSHVMRPDDARSAGASDDAFWMDMFPAWSPDGTELIFARYSVPDGTSEILRMSRSDRKATEAVDLASIDLSMVVGPILWLADGSIIFTGAGGEDGIWETSLASGESRLILKAADPDLPGAVAVSASADGEWLSVYSNRNVQMANVKGFFGLVERETGEIQIFTFAEGPKRFVNVVPRFGPKGSYVAATFTGNPQTLIIWDITTGKPVVFVSLPAEGPDAELRRVGLSWVANDTILVPGPDESAQIVEVRVGP